MPAAARRRVRHARREVSIVIKDDKITAIQPSLSRRRARRSVDLSTPRDAGLHRLPHPYLVARARPENELEYGLHHTPIDAALQGRQIRPRHAAAGFTSAATSVAR